MTYVQLHCDIISLYKYAKYAVHHRACMRSQNKVLLLIIANICSTRVILLFTCLLYSVYHHAAYVCMHAHTCMLSFPRNKTKMTDERKKTSPPPPCIDLCMMRSPWTILTRKKLLTWWAEKPSTVSCCCLCWSCHSRATTNSKRVEDQQQQQLHRGSQSNNNVNFVAG